MIASEQTLDIALFASVERFRRRSLGHGEDDRKPGTPLPPVSLVCERCEGVMAVLEKVRAVPVWRLAGDRRFVRTAAQRAPAAGM